MVVLDSTIANIALPYIGKDLDIDQANLSWIVTGYALAFGGLLLLGGRLGDLYGRRRIFMIGVTIFAVASRLGGLAQNEAHAARLPGACRASAPRWPRPTALALITTTFPAGPLRNRAFSVYAAMSGVGAAVGLILGGWLTGLDPSSARHRRLAADLPDQRADRPGRGVLRARACCAESESPPRPARRARRRHRHPRPARHRLRPHPGRQPGRASRLERPLDHRRPGRRRRAARALRADRAPGRAPAAAVPDLRATAPGPTASWR